MEKVEKEKNGKEKGKKRKGNKRIQETPYPLERLYAISVVALNEGCSHDAIRKHYKITLNGFGHQCVAESELIERRRKENAKGLRENARGSKTNSMGLKK